jgi:1-deoxy-D-xylulose-5-phosphate synthase
VTSLLERIESPTDVRALPASRLDELCRALRQQIIDVCGRSGGHLGASLGAVELIVALHRVFRTPVDRLVFDVGHQAYAHKLLTGRRARFATLRQGEGLAPFLDPRESDHDAFPAGHACTAISAAVGLLEGLQLTGQPGEVVAIVGDGAMTGGQSFEGLNHAAIASRRLTIVLNDNGMSISKNVGAVPTMLEVTGRGYFEALGFTYRGPFDGHDVATLERELRAARDSSKPAVLHVRTQKGRGFAPAEADRATRGHAMGPYELRDGKLVRGRRGLATWSDAFAAALERAMDRDGRVVAITPAMIEGSSLSALQTKFPRRVFDVGIAEQHAVTFAGGMAKAGARAVVCLYSTFLQRAVDQIIHDVALPGLPVIFAVDRAGLVGADGATHQGAFDVSLLRAIPQLSLRAPVFPDDLDELLSAALEGKGPTALRFPRGVIPGPRPAAVAPARTPRWLHRAGQGVLTFITSGPLGVVATEAARGRPWSVLDAFDASDLSTLPWDELSRGALVVVEEGTPRGGLGSAVLESLARRGLEVPVRVVGLPERTFVQHGEANAQRQALGLSVEGLIAAAAEVLAP